MKQKKFMKKKKIKIKYIAKSEGHSDLEAKILKGKIVEARVDVRKGARLIEGIVLGRKIEEIPEIVARICGICPIAHNLASIKALENALDIKVPKVVEDLRKIMQYGQIIQSHMLHIFITISDYFGLEDSLEIKKLFPLHFKRIFEIREFGNEVVETIGGRAIHPVASIVGGFSVSPSKKRLREILKEADDILEKAIFLSSLFKKIKFPEFRRETEYISLSKKNSYPFYEGNIVSNKGLFLLAKDFKKELKEFQRPKEVVNLVKHKGSSYLLGALARIINSGKYLSPPAKEVLENLKIDFSSFNSFHILPAQMIEIVESIYQIKKMLPSVLKEKFDSLYVSFKPKKGKGVGVIEAPRGLLFHFYATSSDGKIEKADIITPTAQFLFNLEKDIEALSEFFPKNAKKKEKIQLLKMLVRVYDLCIACAVK